MVRKRQIALAFQKQLVKEYDDNYHNIPKCLQMYFGFLKTFANPDLTEFTPWQYDDLLMMCYNSKIDVTREPLETVLIYSRRGGKSRVLTIKDVFFSVLQKDCSWFAPHSDQLKQAGKWFNMNPFVRKVAIHSRNEVDILGGKAIDIGVLSEGRVASKDTDVITYDEGGWVFKNRKNYEYYKTSRFMVSAADFKIINHASTPARYSVISGVWDKCVTKGEKLNTRLTAFHPVVDCFWITPEMIEAERLENIETPWFIDQNFHCKWVNYGGSVFTKIIAIPHPTKLQFGPDFLDKIPATHAGVDFNAGDWDSPHYIVTGAYDDSFIYVLDEFTFIDLHFLHDTKFDFVSLELEDDLWNTQFTEQTKSMGLNCGYLGWNEAEKMERVQQVRNRTTIIDPLRAPKTYDNFLTATYDKKSRLAKLEKRTDQHGLDCVLHFMHQADGKIYVSERGKRAQYATVMGQRKGFKTY